MNSPSGQPIFWTKNTVELLSADKYQILYNQLPMLDYFLGKVGHPPKKIN